MNSENFWKIYRQNIHILSLPDEFKCAVCKVIMVDPYFLSCSHDYCLDCKNKLFFEENNICSICNEEVNNVMINKKLIKKLKEAEIPCLNCNECDWKGDLNAFESHCNECDFMPVPCDLNCEDRVLRKMLMNHKENECTEREVSCEYCQKLKKSKNYTNHLDKECSEIPVVCPNECKQNGKLLKIKKQEIKYHIEECENRLIACFVCAKSVRNKDIENHIKDNIYSHMQLFNQEIQFLKKENESKNQEIRENKNEITKLKEIISDLKQEKNSKYQEIQKKKEELKINNKDEDLLENDIKIESPPELIKFHHRGGVSSLLLFSKNLLISGGMGNLKYWDPEIISLILDIENAHEHFITSLAKFNEVHFASGSRDKTIKIWHIELNAPLIIFKEHTDEVSDLLTLSNNYLASGSIDNLIKIWELKSENSIKTINITSPVFCVIEIRKNEILIGSMDKNIRFWNLNTDKNTKTLKAHVSYVLCLLKINDSIFASGSKDNKIKIWDYPSGNCLNILHGHSHWIRSLILLDDDTIASGSNDKSVKVWKISTGENLFRLNGHTNPIIRLIKINDYDFVSGSLDENMIILRNYQSNIIK